MNMEIIKQTPIIVTKKISIRSKNEWLPFKSKPYKMIINVMAIPSTGQ